MNFLIQFYPAIDSATIALMIVFLVVQWRDAFMRIRDALYWNMLPFMWVIAAALVGEEVFISAPVHLATGVAWKVVFDAVTATIWAIVGVQWFKRWRNSDDDTWKKRRRKITEKIQQVGDRLVPVPVTN